MAPRTDKDDAVKRWEQEARAVPLIDWVPSRYHITLKGTGNDRCGPCPVCRDGVDRFSVDIVKNVYQCRKCTPDPGQGHAGGDIIQLVRKVENVSHYDACEILTGRTKPDGPSVVRSLRTKEEEYIYYDANGQPYGRADRMRDSNGKKSFVQFSWQGDGWVQRGMPAGARIPYRLPQLLANARADEPVPVIIAEGERKCDALAKLGYVATCNSMGAGNWHSAMQQELVPYFKDANVIVLCDNDDKGRTHGRVVCGLLHGVAKRVRLLFIEDAWPCKTKQDIYDFIQQLGGDKDTKAQAVADLIGKAKDWPLPEPGPATKIRRIEMEALDQFLREQDGTARYVSAQKQWIIFTGSIFVDDEKGDVLNRITMLCRDLMMRAENERDAAGFGSYRFVADLEKLARTTPGCAVALAELDGDDQAMCFGENISRADKA